MLQVSGSLSTKKQQSIWTAVLKCWRKPIFPGRYQPSIFGTSELNFRVRDGNGWTLVVINTNYVHANLAELIKYHLSIQKATPPESVVSTLPAVQSCTL